MNATFILLTSAWLAAGDPGWDPLYDLIVNGVIDVADLIAVADCWGYPP